MRCASDGLLFSTGVELRFHEDGDGSRLQVQPDSADLDLHDQRTESIRGGKLFDDLRMSADRHIAVRD
jgi:hypothetical protein